MPDLLIELFSEEIPARMQAHAAEDLKKRVTDGLVDAGLTYASAAGFATPRRLALTVEGLASESPTLQEERKGPRVDAPEKAIEGFLRGSGLTRDDLEIRDEKKGQVFFAKISKPGRPASDIIAEVLEDTIRNFPWPKSMRWGAGSLRWVRPLHSILCILTDEIGEATVVPLEIDGITAGNATLGHRFMSKPGDWIVPGSFEDYEAELKAEKVILRAEERAEIIWQEASNQAFAAGLEVVEDQGLLREVAGLVEWPVVLMGAIDAEFLDLPPEVLQTSMREHQKFFSVKNAKTGRIERFITVANRETADHGATILAGNQKVLSARLSDAKFFWENDLRVAKEGMAPWLESLKNVTFHNKLGSQAERIERIAMLARELADVTGADADLAEQAARVAKADLSSEMVYEFPELQGLMGRYYSEAAGLPAEIAAACEEHYSPLGPSDAVPTAPVSVTVALADKLDTFTAFWAMNELPSGSKDPFGLRRAALGLFRIVLENNTKLKLSQVLSESFDSRLKQTTKVLRRYITTGSSDEKMQIVEEQISALWQTSEKRRDGLLVFLHDRLKVFLRDEGIRHDVIDACIAMEGNDDLALLVKRARALQEVLSTEDGENLVQGFKRADNLLTQAEEKDGVEYSFGADPKFAEDETEKALFAALDAADAKIAKASKEEDFTTAMAAMADLRGPIDAFFEAVQINSDNEILRRNRLNLLHKIREICLQAADLRKLEG